MSDDTNDPPYSTVRQLRAEYLARVASSSTSSPSARSRPPRRGTVFGTKPTISLPYIPEVEEERRASYHVESSSYSHTSHSQHQNISHNSHPPPSSPPPIPATIQHQTHPSQHPPPTTQTVLNRPLSKSQLLYPPGSTENIASEHKPAIRPPEKTVYENNPVAPSELNVQVKRAPPSGPPPPPPQPPTDIDYPERLMSPPPTHQPRSILKGYSSQQYYSQTNLTESHHHHSHQTQNTQESFHPQQMHPRPSDRRTPTHFEDLSEDEKTRIMHENLQKHRNLRSGPNGPRPATTSFNGPFFRLEQVSPRQHTQQQQGYPQQHPRSQSVDPSGDVPRDHGRLLQQSREISASEIELHNYSRNVEPSVVVWPPISEKERKRPNSVLAKNFNDPDKIDEYQRQKRLEHEAMHRHEEQQMISMSKQIRAMEIQQQRLYEQSHGVTSPVPIMEAISPQPYGSQPQHQPQQYYPPPPPPPQVQIHQPHQPHQPHQYKDPEPTSYPVQVFETRPISALSDQIDQDPRSQPQAPATSWKRTYIVERPRDVAKNEILTSEELLEKESYDVDLLKRRETFVEKPDEPPRINRLGKRWQPPPEKPYVWPTLRRAMSVEPNSRGPMDFAPGVPPNYDDNEEYKWEPVVNDPGYKKEDKNFTPVSSPPASPRRGHGVGPLDEPAKRQAKYVIQPSPDGSHRPKAVFRKERHTPSGGFYPHAPNAIKVVKKRAQSVQGLLSPTDNVEIIHQRNYHRLDLEQNGHHGQKLRRSQHSGSEMDLRRNTQDLPDWEKIYELPPHSSQIVQKDMPRHVDVQRRLSKFEGSIQNLRAASSTQHLDSMQQLHFPMPDYEPPQLQHSRRRTESSGTNYRGGPPPPPPPMPVQQPREMSRRNSVASTRIDSPSLMIPHHHHHQRQSRSDSRGPPQMSRAASSIPLSPQPTPQHHHHHHQRPTTPGATRARNYIARATAPSPTPYSYDRARAYVPPALPPGYRLADPLPDQRALSPSPGHTRKLIRNGANKPPANAELDEISKRAEELRKRDGRSKYKLVESDIYKTDPDPMPSNLKDQVRELLESRNSVETTTTQRDQDKSGYVTDVSTATWNFSTLDYSPRSVVSMNGARYDILKTVPPLRTKTPPPPPPPVRRHEIYEQHERYTSAPNLQSAVIRIQDDKPRSIMKRRELESREQLLFPTVDTQVVKSVVRKPTVTETVQRFEETRRTEEVERRVQRREKKERRSRHHSSSRHQSGWEGHTGGYQEHRVGAITSSLPRRQIIREADRAMTEEEMNKVVREAYAAADEARRDSRHRSSSLSRGGYLPGGQETYYRQETTRRQQHNNYDDNFNRGIAHARYGSLSDSLRRGELQYVPNGEVRQSFYRDGGASGGQRMHKSYSTRDVFTGDAHDDRRSVSSFHRRGSQQQVSPFVEFPPTLPRRGAGGDYRREEDAYFRPVSKSRSYADWDDAGRAGMGREVRRYDDDMSRLEAEFRDSLLMPMPNGNMNERDHRTEQLPGGYETFNKDRHANSGRRTGRDGKPVDFSEASQEYNYKREQTLNDDRRRR
ncbi:hypothetical protein B9Z55_008385 [Caenorhabditis nigoni]|uniref:Uncharacterized protein n=1 Tax=Caenorhabditis nigoni TaxID=1611254 RepID=A0A2G5UME1_9PELO|nr:hypothetical protein B9Z55_008385 [Caenorhabditis nigoni]